MKEVNAIQQRLTCSKSTTETQSNELNQIQFNNKDTWTTRWCRSSVIIVNFEQISHCFGVFIVDFKQLIVSWSNAARNNTPVTRLTLIRKLSAGMIMDGIFFQYYLGKKIRKVRRQEKVVIITLYALTGKP